MLRGPLAAATVLASATLGQVLEIPVPDLQDIAEVRPDPRYRAVIVYNPTLCQQVGSACGFFRAHEYGHVTLDHQFRPPDHLPAEREASADCWAARNAIPQEVLAAYQLFMRGGSSSYWHIYGDPHQRAQRVRACAIQAGTWIGP